MLPAFLEPPRPVDALERGAAAIFLVDVITPLVVARPIGRAVSCVNRMEILAGRRHRVCCLARAEQVVAARIAVPWNKVVGIDVPRTVRRRGDGRAVGLPEESRVGIERQRDRGQNGYDNNARRSAGAHGGVLRRRRRPQCFADETWVTAARGANATRPNYLDGKVSAVGIIVTIGAFDMACRAGDVGRTGECTQRGRLLQQRRSPRQAKS